MSRAERCTDREAGMLLAAYELGLLEAQDRLRVERHLDDCAACLMELYALAPVMNTIQADPGMLAQRLQEKTDRLAEPKRQVASGWWSRWQERIWPAGGWQRAGRALVPVALAALIAVLLLRPEGAPQLAGLARVDPVPYVPIPTRAVGEAQELFQRGMGFYTDEDYGAAAPLLAAGARAAGGEDATPSPGIRADQIAFYAGLSFLLAAQPESARVYLGLSLASPLPILVDRSHWYLAQSCLLLGDRAGAAAHLDALVTESPGFRSRAIAQREAMRNLQ